MIWCRVAERSQLINRSILSNIRQLVTGDLIKAAIESVAVLSTCRISPCFCCGGAARAAGWLRGAGRALLLCGTGGHRPRIRSSPSPELETPANNQQSTRECHVSRVSYHTRAVSPSSLPWWRSTPRPSTACCPASTADSSSPKLRPVTVNVGRKARTM